MSIKCFIKGHEYEKIREYDSPSDHDSFMATNHDTPIQYTGYDVFRCKRCLKEKQVYNGKNYRR